MSTPATAATEAPSATHDVVCVGTGPEALDALARSEFDVLVSDMRMRPMKGSELLARAYESHRDTQRILLTGFSDHDDLAAAVNHGHVFAYVQKPWDNAQLKLVIRQAAMLRQLEGENRKLTVCRSSATTSASSRKTEE